METTMLKLTVFFEDPFWVGVLERQCGHKLEACKITFGAEPRDYEVYAFLLKNGGSLRFSPVMEAEARQDKRPSPKRMQRAIERQLSTPGAGTKAQQALKLQQEQGKLERRVRSKQTQEAEAERRFALRREKRKEKHRGH